MKKADAVLSKSQAKPPSVKDQVRQMNALVQAAERVLARHATKTRTVFIGRAVPAAAKGASGE